MGHVSGNIQRLDPIRYFVGFNIVAILTNVNLQLCSTGYSIPLGLHDPIKCMTFTIHKQYLSVALGDKVIVMKTWVDGNVVPQTLLSLKSYNSPAISEEVVVVSPSNNELCVNTNTMIYPRSLCFINDSKFLIIVYLEHGIV